jgi:hypothetical protein
MDTLIHADVFFFVTTIAVVIVATVLTIVLLYLVKILRNVKRITEQVHEETVLFREDLHDLRGQVRREGFKLKQLMEFLNRLKKRKTSRSKR